MRADVSREPVRHPAARAYPGVSAVELGADARARDAGPFVPLGEPLSLSGAVISRRGAVRRAVAQASGGGGPLDLVSGRELAHHDSPDSALCDRGCADPLGGIE